MVKCIYLCLSVVCLNNYLLESEEDLHHQVLKENGETRDRPTLLRMDLPVLSLVEHLDIWRERRGGERGGREGEEGERERRERERRPIPTENILPLKNYSSPRNTSCSLLNYYLGVCFPIHQQRGHTTIAISIHLHTDQSVALSKLPRAHTHTHNTVPLAARWKRVSTQSVLTLMARV